jgi:hypothetical protein
MPKQTRKGKGSRKGTGTRRKEPKLKGGKTYAQIKAQQNKAQNMLRARVQTNAEGLTGAEGAAILQKYQRQAREQREQREQKNWEKRKSILPYPGRL